LHFGFKVADLIRPTSAEDSGSARNQSSNVVKVAEPKVTAQAHDEPVGVFSFRKALECDASASLFHFHARSFKTLPTAAGRQRKT
jgi:hypothetical protein